MNEETTRDILACKDRDDLEKLLCKYKEKSLNARMQYDPKFATSPILISDKDYEFSVDPELITLVESDPFYGYESETVVAHLTKLNDIATLFAHEEKIRYYYILKLFPFSLKDDAKIWFNSLDPGCVFRERTIDQAELLLNNILSNDNDWTLPEPTPKTTPKKRGILFLSPEDMQEAKKSMKEKGIKAEDEEIHGLNAL